MSRLDKGTLPNKSKSLYSAVGAYCTLGRHSSPRCKPTSKSLFTRVKLLLLPVVIKELLLFTSIGVPVTLGANGNNEVVKTIAVIGEHADSDG